MTEFRRGQVQGAIEQQLPESRAKQIGSAHHFGDALGGVIHYHCELVSGNIVLSPNHEIAKVNAGDRVLRTGRLIEKLPRFPFRDAETPVHPGRIFRVGYR